MQSRLCHLPCSTGLWLFPSWHSRQWDGTRQWPKVDHVLRTCHPAKGRGHLKDCKLIHAQPIADDIAHAQAKKLFLCLSRNVHSPRSTTHQVSIFCLGKCDVICNIWRIQQKTDMPLLVHEVVVFRLAAWTSAYIRRHKPDLCRLANTSIQSHQALLHDKGRVCMRNRYGLDARD